MKDNCFFTEKSIKKKIKFVLVLCLVVGMFIGCSGSDDKFYTLQEAYVNGWLSVEELQSIAYYYQGNDDKTFVPIALNPRLLTSAVFISKNISVHTGIVLPFV